MKSKKIIKAARKVVADVYDDLMKDIPTIPEDETLDQQIDREMEMEKELGPESDMDVIIRALKKKFNIQSDDVSDILDEAANKAKLSEGPIPEKDPTLN